MRGHRFTSELPMAKYKEITPSQRVEDRLPWFHGEAECKTCGHQWVAVWPLGTDWNKLMCPKCQQQDSDLGWSGSSITIQ